MGKWMGLPQNPTPNLMSKKYLERARKEKRHGDQQKRQQQLDNVNLKRSKRVKEANGSGIPSLTPSQHLGKEAEEVITFEHINVNEINPHDDFVELTNTMGMLEKWRQECIA